MAKAEMDSSPERDVPIGPPLKIQSSGVFDRLRVHVGCRDHGHDPVALLQAHAVELGVPSHGARLRELHRRHEAQKLLDRQIAAAPVGREPIAQAGIS